MPIHDWTREDAGLFHHFHQRWSLAIADALNDGLLTDDYYALAEQQRSGHEPDVLALKIDGRVRRDAEPPMPGAPDRAGVGLLVAPPRVRVTAETELAAYRRKQNIVAVRNASDDRLVAIVEIVSRGNKSGRAAFDDFVRKAGGFLAAGVHLLVLDLQPPTSRDPQGIHGAIWDEVVGDDYARPPDKPLTLAAYEAGSVLRAFVEPVAVGDTPIDMPLFLQPDRYVAVPIEATYRTAFGSVPRHRRAALEA